MLLSLNWLKDFVEIPKSVTPEKLGEFLTLHTVEVEKVERQADRFSKVVVGKILEVKPHPGADRLRLAKVDVGAAGGLLNIVCGAPDIAAGQFVPVALVGAVLPSGAEIKPAEIRGEKSNGMLCAEDELGLGEDHDGIMILAKARIGQNLADYLNLTDVVFEVDNKSITHRADLWSHYGMARDLSAILDAKFKPLKTPTLKYPLLSGAKIKVKVEDFKLCPRYLAAEITDVRVAPSPEWLRERLLAAGVRPINNLVDVTNYVMLELGQPLHAFDRKYLNGIVVRRAKTGESMKTLDGTDRKLKPDMLVIADKTKPVAIAGVMGGAESEINDLTEAVVIEAANFNYDSIRKTSIELGLRTESSMRFEKGLDPNLAELGLIRAIELILKLCPGAKLSGKPVDEKKFKLNQGPIELDLAWLKNVLGAEISAKEAKRILNKLGFEFKAKESAFAKAMTDEEKFSVTVPTWRAVHDVSIREDLAEEVARIYGFNKIKAVMPKIDMVAIAETGERKIIRNIKNILSLGARFTEVYNYSFIKTNHVEALTLVNPLSEDLKYLRATLLDGLSENIKNNQANEERIALYEIGRVFLDKPGEDNLPFQEKRLALALAGGEAEDLFAELKGVIAYLFNSFNLDVNFEVAKNGADIIIGGERAGIIYEIDKQAARQRYGIKKKTVLAEIELNKLYRLIEERSVRAYKEPPKYPAAIRDLAFVINEKILYNNIVEEIKNFSDLISQADLFDVFQGDQLGAGKKSLAFRIIYQAERTLTAQEIDEIQGKLIKHLEKKFEAKIRDF